MFILVSTPSSPLSEHGHKLLLISPIIEGLLGGHSTLQSGTSAYLSDCTSSGSRAYIFSRFAGVFYLGFSIGPVIGGWLISHPVAWIGGSSIPGRQSVTSVFWVAVAFSFINLVLITFVFPESLNKEKRERAMMAYKKSRGLGGRKGKARERALTFSSGDPGISSADEEEEESQGERESGVQSGGTGIISHLLSPLAIFLPVMVLDPSGLGKRRDWSLTLLAGGLFGYMLSLVSSFCESSPSVTDNCF
jgi:MFS family permease